MQNGSQNTRHLGQILALQLDIQVTASTSTNLDMSQNTPCHYQVAKFPETTVLLPTEPNRGF